MFTTIQLLRIELTLDICNVCVQMGFIITQHTIYVINAMYFAELVMAVHGTNAESVLHIITTTKMTGVFTHATGAGLQIMSKVKVSLL